MLLGVIRIGFPNEAARGTTIHALERVPTMEASPRNISFNHRPGCATPPLSPRSVCSQYNMQTLNRKGGTYRVKN